MPATDPHFSATAFSNAVGAIVTMAWAAWGLYAAFRFLYRRWVERGRPRNHAVLFGLIAVVGVALGGDKGQIANAIRRFIVFALYSGGVFDPSGTVATSIERDTLAAFQGETQRIVENSRLALTNSLETAGAMTNDFADLPLAYVSADWPRAIPGVLTNHNVSATIEKTQEEDNGTNIAIYVWFSENLASAPMLSWHVQTAEDEYVEMRSVTNTFPYTVETRPGVRCVKYTCEMPEAMRGMAIRPGYELEWGGPGEGQQLGLSELGVSVTDTNGVEHLPFTGVRVMSVDGHTLRLGISGGICTCAMYGGRYWWGDGQSGTNNVPSYVTSKLGELQDENE